MLPSAVRSVAATSPNSRKRQNPFESAPQQPTHAQLLQQTQTQTQAQAQAHVHISASQYTHEQAHALGVAHSHTNTPSTLTHTHAVPKPVHVSNPSQPQFFSGPFHESTYTPQPSAHARMLQQQMPAPTAAQLMGRMKVMRVSPSKPSSSSTSSSSNTGPSSLSPKKKQEG